MRRRQVPLLAQLPLAPPAFGHHERALRLQPDPLDDVSGDRQALVQGLNPFAQRLQFTAVARRQRSTQPFLLGEAIPKGAIARKFGDAQGTFEFVVLGVQ